jgi:hypothetical protein
MQPNGYYMVPLVVPVVCDFDFIFEPLFMRRVLRVELPDIVPVPVVPVLIEPLPIEPLLIEPLVEVPLFIVPEPEVVPDIVPVPLVVPVVPAPVPVAPGVV